MLTVDFDRLGTAPGDRVLDHGLWCRTARVRDVPAPVPT
jgi:hypothetical protein